MSHDNVVDASPARNPLLTRNFIALVITQTCFGLSFSCYFLLPTFMRLSLHADDVQIGSVAALGSFTGVLAFPLVGTLNDRFGRRPFVLLGSALMAVSSLAMLEVQTAGVLLYLLRVAHGIAFALVFNSATTLVSDEAPREQLGTVLAVFGSSLLATHALAPAIAELLANRHGWSSVFWFSALLALAGALAALRVAEAPRTSDAAPGGTGVWPLLRQPPTRRIVLIIAAAGASFGSVFTFHQPFALSLGMTRVSGFFVAYAVCALFARLWLMGLLRDLSRRTLSGYAMLLYAAAVVGTVWLRPGVLEAVGGLMGVAQGVFYPLYNALAIEAVEPRQRGSMMALYHGGFNAGIALSLLAGGALTSAFGYPCLFVLSALVT
ncbi:MAG TPA: MFS transporter, partial [Polyangiales bacterium]